MHAPQRDQWLAAWIKVKVFVIPSYLTLCNPMDCSPPGASVHGILQAEYWSRLPCLSPGYLPNPGIQSRSPALQADSSPSEPPGKPMNTRVGNLSLLQGIFLTQESNRGLLHHRQILYCLSHQRSPKSTLIGENLPRWWGLPAAPCCSFNTSSLNQF